MRFKRVMRDRRGATLALVAVALVGLLGMGALTIDVGMLYDARAQAQRAADAAALAGASAFRDFARADASGPANTRALDLATRNSINGTLIPATDVTVEVIPDQDKVRVTVRRANIGLWLARVLGQNFGAVSARAAAAAAPAGGAWCVKPFAIPDIWDERNTDPGRTGQDRNANRQWDANEGWNYEPGQGDSYVPGDPADPSVGTGYGSAFRNGHGDGYNDYGRQLTIKSQDPQTAITSGFFYPFRLGNSTGAQDYRDNISRCSPDRVDVGTPYSVENGNMVGPTRQGIDDLLSQDPGARWNPTGGPDGRGAVEGSSYSDWRSSPRVVAVPLFDPSQIVGLQSGGNLQLTFNNIGLFFIEGFAGSGAQAPVQGRFLYYANGTGVGPGGATTGSLVRVLRLVE
jgi:putative Flp pilus-assembly TadE/G-like protein